MNIRNTVKKSKGYVIAEDDYLENEDEGAEIEDEEDDEECKKKKEELIKKMISKKIP